FCLLSCRCSSCAPPGLHSFPTRRSFDLFGAGIVDADGALDRRAIRERIFAVDSARRRLESIVHPLIREGMRGGAEMSTSPYVILDRKSTRLNYSHVKISYAVFCLKKKIN